MPERYVYFPVIHRLGGRRAAALKIADYERKIFGNINTTYDRVRMWENGDRGHLGRGPRIPSDVVPTIMHLLEMDGVTLTHTDFLPIDVDKLTPDPNPET